MIRLLALVIAALVAGGPMAAQTLVVQSGEHEDFTRLVLPLPDKLTWTISRSRRALSLSFDSSTVHFDVSRVFDRIPRSRLTALSQKGPGADLVLSLGCACSVSSSTDTPGYLVIDIRNSKGLPEPRQRLVGLPTNQRPYRFALRGNPMEIAPPAKSSLILPTVIGQLPRIVPSAPSTAPAGNRQTRAHGSLNISEQRLLAQIGRASNQGLIELKEDAQLRVAQASDMQEAEHSGMQEQTDTQDVPLPLSLSAITVFDRDLASIAQSLDQSEAVSICLTSEKVALHDWGGGRPFSEEIGHWRSLLFGEFDRVNPDIAFSLTRAYLHFGFGAEAARTIELTSQTDQDGQILMALAQIIDTGETSGKNPFADQQHCDSDVALWAVLTADALASNANDNAVLLAFSRLPLQLRSYLGPQLSQKYSGFGDNEMASSILRTVARTGTEPGSGIELAKAAVAGSLGDTEMERRELTKSLVSGSEHSPEALVKLVANAFETRGSVSPSIPDLAAAYALEFRDAEIGSELRRTRAVALALAGQFIAAFESLQGIEERDGASDRRLALIPLIALLHERADDVTYLRIALNMPVEASSAVPAEISNKMARRMLDLGFSGQAANWVSSAAEAVASQDSRLLRAEIALAHRLPHRAMVELLGLNGVQAARIRAAAMWQQGDYRQAGHTLAAVEEFDEAARGFWLAEEWDSVPDQADAHYAQVVASSVQLRSITTEPLQLTPLAQARALMQNSSDARAEIETLLQSVSVTSEAQQ